MSWQFMCLLMWQIAARVDHYYSCKSNMYCYKIWNMTWVAVYKMGPWSMHQIMNQYDFLFRKLKSVSFILWHKVLQPPIQLRHMSVMGSEITGHTTPQITLCEGDDRLIPLTKNQWCGKCFHVMTSFCRKMHLWSIKPNGKWHVFIKYWRL